MPVLSSPRSHSTVGKVYNKSLRGLKSIKHLMNTSDDLQTLYSPHRDTTSPSPAPSSSTASPTRTNSPTKLRKSHSYDSRASDLAEAAAVPLPCERPLDVQISERRFGSEFDDSMVDREQLTRMILGEASADDRTVKVMVDGKGFDVDRGTALGNRKSGNHLRGGGAVTSVEVGALHSTKPHWDPTDLSTPSSSPDRASALPVIVERLDSGFSKSSEKQSERPKESLVQPFNARWYFKQDDAIYGPFSGFWMNKLLQDRCITLATQCRRSGEQQFWSAGTFQYTAGEAPNFFLLPYIGIATSKDFLEVVPEEVLAFGEKNRKALSARLGEHVCPLLLKTMDVEDIADDALDELMKEIMQHMDLSKHYEIGQMKRTEKSTEVPGKHDMILVLKRRLENKGMYGISDEMLEKISDQYAGEIWRKVEKTVSVDAKPQDEKVDETSNIQLETAKEVYFEKTEEEIKDIIKVHTGEETQHVEKDAINLTKEIQMGMEYDMDSKKIDWVFSEVSKTWPGTFDKEHVDIVKEIKLEKYGLSH